MSPNRSCLKWTAYNRQGNGLAGCAELTDVYKHVGGRCLRLHPVTPDPSTNNLDVWRNATHFVFLNSSKLDWATSAVVLKAFANLPALGTSVGLEQPLNPGVAKHTKSCNPQPHPKSSRTGSRRSRALPGSFRSLKLNSCPRPAVCTADRSQDMTPSNDSTTKHGSRATRRRT